MQKNYGLNCNICPTEMGYIIPYGAVAWVCKIIQSRKIGQLTVPIATWDMGIASTSTMEVLSRATAHLHKVESRSVIRRLIQGKISTPTTWR